MKRLIWSEHDFLNEVLPTIIVGTALNLVGHLINERFLGLNLLFLDSAGTILTAIILGPWWGASVGVISSSLNGLFTQSWFPFGIVSVFIGLAAGYAARGIPGGLGYIVAGRFSFSRVFSSWLLLTVACALVAGLVSSAVKVVLYPRLGLSLDTGKLLYIAVEDSLGEMGAPHADGFALILCDLARDFIDKGLTVALALSVVAVSGLQITSSKLPTMEPVRRTDTFSIFVFGLIYTGALTMARISAPIVQIRGRSEAGSWMDAPELIVYLYLPIVLGLLAYLLSSSPGADSLRLERERELRRRSLIFDYLGRFGIWTQKELASENLVGLFKRDGIYGLLLSVILWPYSKKLPDQEWLPALAYVLGMAGLAAVYFSDRRALRKRLQTAQISHARLESFHARNDAACAVNALHATSDLLDDCLVSEHESICNVDGQWILPAVVAGGSLDRLSATADPISRVAVFAADRNARLNTACLGEIDRVSKISGADLTVVLTGSANPKNQDLAAVLRGVRLPERALLLLGWEEQMEMIAAYTRGDAGAALLTRLHLRSMRIGMQSHVNEVVTSAPSGQALAMHVLPEVAEILLRLPPHSQVLDLGAGFGRHSLRAIEAGHLVKAVEKKSETFSVLAKKLRELDPGGRRHVAINADLGEVELPGLALLAVVTGVLQHACDEVQLEQWLSVVKESSENAVIEMLYGMKFDGRIRPGRVTIEPDAFHAMLCRVFHEDYWCIQKTSVLERRRNQYSGTGRSFLVDHRECTFHVEVFVVTQGGMVGLP